MKYMFKYKTPKQVQKVLTLKEGSAERIDYLLALIQEDAQRWYPKDALFEKDLFMLLCMSLTTRFKDLYDSDFR